MTISPQDASGFVMLSEICPDIIQEIRYFTTYNFIGDRVDGYEEPVALLTRKAAEALVPVCRRLKAQGWLLKVFDAYRPQSAVEHFVRWADNPADVRMKPFFYPDVDKSRLFELDFISRRSGHSRGSTLDVTLFDMAKGCDADMGSPFDWFGERSHPSCRAGISPIQYDLRMLLQRTMAEAGFRPLSSDWWHFTLREEPYPDTYFTFPVSRASLSGKQPDFTKDQEEVPV